MAKHTCTCYTDFKERQDSETIEDVLTDAFCTIFTIESLLNYGLDDADNRDNIRENAELLKADADRILALLSETEKSLSDRLKGMDSESV